MRITAVVAPQAADGIEILRRGCRSPDKQTIGDHDI
jgi:hypothetical protein